MSNWLRYFSFFGRNPRVDATEEVRFHLEMRVRDLVARGLTPDAARAEAERRFGDVRGYRAALGAIDEGRRADERRAGWWDAFRHDLRHSLRGLRRPITTLDSGTKHSTLPRSPVAAISSWLREPSANMQRSSSARAPFAKSCGKRFCDLRRLSVRAGEHDQDAKRFHMATKSISNADRVSAHHEEFTHLLRGDPRRGP